MRLDKNNILAELVGRMETDNAEILQQPVAGFLGTTADGKSAFKGCPRRTSRKEQQIDMCALVEVERILQGLGNK
ncbi:MAG: hypothetical protein FJ123_03820 [Deltaproteobacteria bacterium]|nr:hypothetical protein [Deltaproteobacteria bacterium]